MWRVGFVELFLQEWTCESTCLCGEAGRPCLPEGILRLVPRKAPLLYRRRRGRAEDLEGELLPEAKWMCKGRLEVRLVRAVALGRDLPIDEWIRLGRCRHAWRLPLSSGPTRWRPPLRYQWAEPDAPWEALTWVDMRARCQEEDQLKGSPVIRRFEGSAEDFRKHWQQASAQGVESEI